MGVKIRGAEGNTLLTEMKDLTVRQPCKDKDGFRKVSKSINATVSESM